jgi:hypothetical protein
MSTFAPVALPRIAPPDPSKHVNYQLGMVLGVDDFKQEFTYLSERTKRVVRDLVGYGIVAGLDVAVEVAADERGPRVNVSPGEAVTPSGQLICVAPAQCAYLNEWLRANRDTLPVSPPGGLELTLVACYREAETDDVPIPGEPCRSEDELMKPSRVKDCFELELRLEPPEQLEEHAVRDFVAWARQIPVVDAPPGDVGDFVAALEELAESEMSPPSSPEDPYAFLVVAPPPGLEIPRAAAGEYLAALLAFWTTTLRQRVRAARPGAECGCTGGPGEVDPDADCLPLASLRVPLAVDLGGETVVADTPAIEIDVSGRATLVHLRMLQELLLGGLAAARGGAALCAGVNEDGTIASANGNLQAMRLPAPNDRVYVLDVPGHDPAATYAVTGTPRTALAAASPATFELIPPDDPDLIAALGSPPTDGVAVRVRHADGSAVAGGFIVRIEAIA